MLRTWILFLVFMAERLSGGEPHSPDLNKIDRHIVKEPHYVSDRPCYGLLVLGPEAKTKVWAVFDKSSPDSVGYDILYFDRKADGDLTHPDNRIEGKLIEGKPSLKNSRWFAVGSFDDPSNGDKYSDVNLIQYGDYGDGPVEHPLSVGIRIKWRDHFISSSFSDKLGAEARKNLQPRWNFADNVSSAPIFWFGGSAPLSFNGSYLKPLNIGRLQNIQVQLGFRGVGENTFSAVLSDFLSHKTPVQFSLKYTDTDGHLKEIKQDSRKRYSYYYYDFVKIPADAQAGNATLHCSLPTDSGNAVVPADFPVELIHPTADTPDDDDPSPYDEAADGSQQITDALAIAKANNKRVLLQFGANWCWWCNLLHNLFEKDQAIRELLQKSYVVVLVDVNQGHNKEVDARYGTPTKHGLPVLVILDSDGKQLVTKDTGELEEGDHHSPDKVLEFLNEWAPKR